MHPDESMKSMGPMTGRQPERPEVYEKLQMEIDRMDSLVSGLAHVLGPVLVQGADTMPHGPEEAPYHDYHNLVLRLSQQNTRLADVVSAIKL